VVLAALVASTACRGPVPETGWPVYGGRNGDRYSSLTQIDRSNVGDLEVAWRFETGEAGESQTHPIVVGRKLFGYTPDLDVIALDAASGALLWRFDAGLRASGPHRGLAHWQGGGEARLLAGIMNRLYALDPATGTPIATFGENGSVDLRKDLRLHAALCIADVAGRRVRRPDRRRLSHLGKRSGARGRHPRL
jgi:quinoprotein glucose dehydrogenase